MRHVRGLRWYIAGLLFLVTTINYLDRTSLSVAAPTLKSELGINEQQYAYILICFQICYMLMQPVSGRLLDGLKPRLGFALAVAWWSVANMLHAFARTPLMLGVFRGLLGVGEAANFPGLAKLAGEWFPPKERTIATGIANIGAGTGALIATPLVAWIILKFGWQEAFVVTGAIGLLWIVLWLIVYHPVDRHPWLSPEEAAYIRAGQAELNAEAQSAEPGTWGLILRQRNFWGIAAARFLAEPAWQFFSYWIPMYLVTQRGMDLKQIAYFAWIPFIAADVGSLVGGLLSPIYQRIGVSVLVSRKLALVTSALMMPLILMIGSAPTAGWAIFWFCWGTFAHQCLAATLLTLPADLFPQRTVATANGLTGCFSHCGGMLFTLIAGTLVMSVGYGPLFKTLAFLDLAGIAALWILIRMPTTPRGTSGPRGFPIVDA